MRKTANLHRMKNDGQTEIFLHNIAKHSISYVIVNKRIVNIKSYGLYVYYLPFDVFVYITLDMQKI